MKEHVLGLLTWYRVQRRRRRRRSSLAETWSICKGILVWYRGKGSRSAWKEMCMYTCDPKTSSFFIVSMWTGDSMSGWIFSWI